jgi:hypothetical protein
MYRCEIFIKNNHTRATPKTEFGECRNRMDERLKRAGRTDEPAMKEVPVLFFD